MAGDVRRSKIQIEKDRENISHLYLRGWSQCAISDELGISQPTVSRDLKAIQQAWRESSLIDMNEAKQKELAKIDELERTYWEAWLRSCEDTETETLKKVGHVGDGAAKLETAKRKEGQSGNPAFLAGVERCIRLRIDIIGLEAPKRQEVSGPSGEALRIIIGGDDA